MNTDRIEKTLILHAPQSRVWQALVNADQFGAWFGMALQGQFVPNAQIRGNLTNPEYTHLTIDMRVEEIVPEHFFSYRWHPFAIEPEVDYGNEPMTLVAFHLTPVGNDTQLTITESGFDQIPAERRATAFRMNNNGWSEQLTNLERYVTTQ